MALTPDQLTILREDLRTLAQIEYEEVENELLDHYATLTEQKMAAGHDFEHGSSYAWAELGAGVRLKRIQVDYEKNIRRQVASRHLEILKNYFRWPIIVVTILTGILVYLIRPFWGDHVGPIFLWSSVFILLGILQYSRYNYQRGRKDSKAIVLQSLGGRMSNMISFVNLFFNYLFFTHRSGIGKVVRAYPGITMLICLTVVLYSLSLIQLFRENFTYKSRDKIATS